MSSGSGGEPGDPSDWTLQAYRVYMRELLAERDRRLEQRFSAQEQAVDKALASIEKATDKSERDIERWRAASNEWRNAMDDREAKFVQYETFDARTKGITDATQARLVGLEHQIAALDSKIDDLTRSRDLAAGRQAAQVAGIGLIFAIITITLRFL